MCTWDVVVLKAGVKDLINTNYHNDGKQRPHENGVSISQLCQAYMRNSYSILVIC